MYRPILSNGPEPFRTGMPSTLDKHAIRSGFEELWCGPMDAPDGMPAGGIYRVEWDNHIEPGIRSWFLSQIITIRDYQ